MSTHPGEIFEEHKQQARKDFIATVCPTCKYYPRDCRGLEWKLWHDSEDIYLVVCEEFKESLFVRLKELKNRILRRKRG